MSGKRITGGVFAGVMLIGAGCASRPAAVPAVSALPQQDSQAVGSATYDLAGGGRVEVYHQGYGVRKAAGVPVGSLRIQFSVRNDGEGPLVFDSSETHLVDNRGDTLPLGAMKVGGQPSPSLLEVAAGSHAQVDLFFDLPGGYPLSKVENFRVYWGHARGGTRVATETLFVRKDPANMYWLDERGRKRPYRYFMAVKV